MMAARTRKIRHDDETRAKIQAAQLINRMMKCVDGKVELSQSQVSCAKALLAKVLPDLSQIQANVDSTVTIADLSEDELDARIAAAERQAGISRVSH